MKRLMIADKGTSMQMATIEAIQQKCTHFVFNDEIYEVLVRSALIESNSMARLKDWMKSAPPFVEYVEFK